MPKKGDLVKNAEPVSEWINFKKIVLKSQINQILPNKYSKLLNIKLCEIVELSK